MSRDRGKKFTIMSFHYIESWILKSQIYLKKCIIFCCLVIDIMNIFSTVFFLVFWLLVVDCHPLLAGLKVAKQERALYGTRPGSDFGEIIK